MLTSEDYKQLAKRCAELAGECSVETMAQALRALALDYSARATELRKLEATATSRARSHQGTSLP
jgi:hypothetical protein